MVVECKWHPARGCCSVAAQSRAEPGAVPVLVQQQGLAGCEHRLLGSEDVILRALGWRGPQGRCCLRALVLCCLQVPRWPSGRSLCGPDIWAAPLGALVPTLLQRRGSHGFSLVGRSALAALQQPRVISSEEWAGVEE